MALLHKRAERVVRKARTDVVYRYVLLLAAYSIGMARVRECCSPGKYEVFVGV